MMIVAIILVLSALAVVYFNDSKEKKKLIIESEELRRFKEKDDLNRNFIHAQNIAKSLIRIIELHLDDNKHRLEFNINSVNRMEIKGRLIGKVYLKVDFYISSSSVSADMLITDNGVEHRYERNLFNKNNDASNEAFILHDYIDEHTYKILNS